MKYRRVLLKFSGEALAGSKPSGIDFDEVLNFAKEIKECAENGIEIAIVVGGGNFWRGKANPYMDRATSDYIGMLATTMNALALGDAFKQIGQDVRVQTGIEMRQVAEFYIKDRAIRHLEKGRITILVVVLVVRSFLPIRQQPLEQQKSKQMLLLKQLMLMEFIIKIQSNLKMHNLFHIHLIWMC